MAVTRWTLHEGECLAWLRTLEAESCDALVTDPPAGVSFMGAKWDDDRGGRTQWIAWLAEVLTERHRALKPGASAFVWALPRTSHWTGMALEDAGFEVRDSVHHFFGNGWPKSRSLLKPAHEVWWLARKPGPLRELNVDACRIGMTKRVPGSVPTAENHVYGTASVRDGSTGGYDPNVGRWPPNVLLSHSDACVQVGERVVHGDNRAGPKGVRPSGFGDVGAESGDDRPNGSLHGDETVPVFQCDESCPVAELDRQSGELTSGLFEPHHADSGRTREVYNPMAGRERDVSTYGDTGGASRFFPTFRYQAKPSTAERNQGAGSLPARIASVIGEDTTGPISKVSTMPRANHHSTTKSIELMRWLCRLIVPAEGLVLDPFTGSGSTGVAAIEEHFRFTGCEREPDYCAIARARIGFVAERGTQMSLLGSR